MRHNDIIGGQLHPCSSYISLSSPGFVHSSVLPRVFIEVHLRNLLKRDPLDRAPTRPQTARAPGLGWRMNTERNCHKSPTKPIRLRRCIGGLGILSICMKKSLIRRFAAHTHLENGSGCESSGAAASSPPNRSSILRARCRLPARP